MRILHINFTDIGGAGNAAIRLHRALLSAGINSIYATNTISDDDPSKIRLNGLFSNKYANSLLSNTHRILDKSIRKIIYYIYKNKHQFSYSGNIIPNSINRLIKKVQPDIIHLHWIADGVLSFYALAQLSKLKIPVCWTIHDTWPFTGGCHIFDTCTQWKQKCTDCPLFLRKVKYAFPYMQWVLKKAAYQKLSPHIISLSHQFTHFIKESSLCHDLEVSYIPNTIDTNIFYPIPRDTARDILSLEKDKKYILFGTFKANNAQHKGGDILIEALSKITNTDKTEIVIFGTSHNVMHTTFPLPVRYLGVLHDEISMALAYSAADLFVCPSRRESFSNTTLESLSCGVPVVAFPVGGIPEMVDHKKNGFLASPYSSDDLAYYIDITLKNNNLRKSMSICAREKVIKNFSMPIVAEKYINLYKGMLRLR